VGEWVVGDGRWLSGDMSCSRKSNGKTRGEERKRAKVTGEGTWARPPRIPPASLTRFRRILWKPDRLLTEKSLQIDII
ncbi:hypothetical protein AVEN_126601-1, partial [Araneus ventricosus]